jgi:NodT family efflux transporter outer membrane factor (OMF) lipoprotein
MKPGAAQPQFRGTVILGLHSLQLPISGMTPGDTGVLSTKGLAPRVMQREVAALSQPHRFAIPTKHENDPSPALVPRAPSPRRRGLCSFDFHPVPVGEGGQRPAHPPAGGGRVRGSRNSQIRMTWPKLLLEKQEITISQCKPHGPRGWLQIAPIILFALLLAGCAVGPHYTRPPVTVPPAYKERGPSTPVSTQAISTKWWKMFNDPELNSLEAQIQVSDQTLKQAFAQYEQARALVRYYRSGLFPTVAVGPSAAREHTSYNRPPLAGLEGKTYTDLLMQGDLSYEVDAWGRVRRTVESARESAQASAADLATVNLSLQSELAMDYFDLRNADAEEKLLKSTVTDYEKTLQLTENLYRGGLDSDLDVEQARAQLDATEAQEIDLGVARAQYEHAIAVLVGKPASVFSIPFLPLGALPPKIPVGLPSQLLESRPDVAAAERQVAAANAQIGVARAAYFPQILLSASGGFESGNLTTLFEGPSGLWAFGGSALETLFEGGQRHALSAEARAAYDQTVAAYRQTVLTAFQNVEDSLAALRILQQEAAKQSVAVAAAQRSVVLSLNEYKGGLVAYLQVLTAQTVALSDQLTGVNILGRRTVATVQLIEAVGGGWNTSKLPSP